MDSTINNVSIERKASSHKPAGYLKRFLAAIIDGIAVTIISAPFTYGFPILFGVIGLDSLAGLSAVVGTILGLVASYAYYWYFLTKKGSTPGKELFGFKVLNIESMQYLNWKEVFLREIVGKSLIYIVTLGIAFIVNIVFLFRDDKRLVHDFIAKSVVVEG